MEEKLQREVAARLEKGESPAQIRQALLGQGYGEPAIEEVLKGNVSKHIADKNVDDIKNSRILAVQETIDRIGYGAAAPQFINILFYITGSGLFLLGLFNAFKTVISMVITAVLQEYAKLQRVSKNVISGAGILFGFSFLLMAFALQAKLVWLYATGILLASIGVVVYGDLYHKFSAEIIRPEKKGKVLAKMGQYGVLITMVAMLLSGYLIETVTPGAELFGFPVVGYLLSFEITAFAFIISGYMLSFLKEKRQERTYALGKFLKEHTKALKSHMGSVLKNKFSFLLFLATAITGILEVLGHSYYGLFIYQTFNNNFIIVAVLYALAILTSFIGPWFTKKLQRAIGLSPMLVFGTLLSAILPLTLVYSPMLGSVGLALIFSVMGASIVGVAQGLLARKIMDEQSRKKYFMSVGMMLAIPYLILIPLGAYAAETYGLTMLFMGIGVGLALVVMPLYFILVAFANKQRL